MQIHAPVNRDGTENKGGENRETLWSRSALGGNRSDATKDFRLEKGSTSKSVLDSALLLHQFCTKFGNTKAGHADRPGIRSAPASRQTLTPQSGLHKNQVFGGLPDFAQG